MAKQARLRAIDSTTKDLYGRVLERAFGDVGPVGPIRDRVLEGMPESVRHTLRAAVVRHWAEKGDPEYGRRLASDIPAVKRIQRARRHAEEKEIARFEHAVRRLPARAQPVLMLALHLGLRAEELLSLTREQIEEALRTGRLVVLGKGKKERILPTAQVKALLRDALAQSAAVPHALDARFAMYEETGNKPREWWQLGDLLASNEAKLSTKKRMFANHVKRCAQIAGLDPQHWSPHALRHAFASRMNRDGAPLPTTQAALGHADIKTTQRYIHVTPSDIAKHVRRKR